MKATPFAKSKKRGGWRTFVTFAVTLGVVALLIVVGAFLRRDEQRNVTTVPPAPDSKSHAAVRADGPAVITTNADGMRTPAFVPDDVRPAAPGKNAPSPEAVANSKSSSPAPAKGSIEKDNTQGTATAHARVSPPLPASIADDLIVQHVNSALRANWKKHNVSPAPAISISQWCERAYRVVLGREPTAAEWESFQSDSKSDRKEKLLASFLSDRYAEEFSRRWSGYLVDVFLDPDCLDEGSVANREGLLQYFRRSLLDRKPFDEVAAGMLTATGSGVPGHEKYDGAANFLLARADKDATNIRATADVCRLFMGRSVECQQCHDGPHFDSGKQGQFWELNSFFRQLKVQADDSNRPALLVDVDFAGDSLQGERADVVFQRTNGLLKCVYPVFLDGTEVAANGQIAVVNRRQELAWLVTHSPDFRRTMTNRIWSAVLGRGIVPHEEVVRNNTRSYPEPLVEISDQFAAHGYDIRKVIFWAALSEPFQLAAEPGSATIAASDSEMPLFDRFYDEPFRPKENAYTRLLAMAKDFGSESGSTPAAAKIEPFRKPFDKKGNVVEPPPPSESLLVSNGGVDDPMLKALLSNSKLTPQQKAEHLFQMAFHRQPRPRELALVKQMLDKAGDNPQSALNALWAALNAGAN